jgi:protein-disulfide isomerase
LIITRRAFTAALSLTGLAALAGFSPLRLISDALAQGPADVAKPQSLPDMALGPANASVTITEYASMTCPHCAHFHETVYPELKKRYIDAGKVRFIFREFPLDPLAAGASMMARCADKDKFYPLIETLFQQQRQWAVEKPIPKLLALAKQAGMSEQTFNACLSDQKMLDAMQAEQKRATDKFGVNSTPTVFVNGKKVVGGTSIEDLAKIIDPLLTKS